jgi:hypothetical protein
VNVLLVSEASLRTTCPMRSFAEAESITPRSGVTSERSESERSERCSNLAKRGN